MGSLIQARLTSYVSGSGIRPSSVGLYHPVHGEVETEALFSTFKSWDCSLFYPKVVRKTKQLRFLPIDSLTELKKGAYGIKEPSATGQGASSLDLLVMPGLAFDEEGGRIGYGAGYYDRLYSFPVKERIGLSYDFQILPKLPKSPHDLSCDVIISEKRILKKERLL